MITMLKQSLSFYMFKYQRGQADGVIESIQVFLGTERLHFSRLRILNDADTFVD